MFIFGALENEVPAVMAKAKQGNYPIDPRLQEVFKAIKDGKFSLGDDAYHAAFCGMVDKLCNTTAAGTWDGDRYLVVHDFPSFLDAQARVDAIYSKDQAKWCSLSIKAAASMAKFSTDRTISEYSSVIWGVKPAPRPLDAAASGAKVSGPDAKAAALQGATPTAKAAAQKKAVSVPDAKAAPPVAA